MQKITVEDFTRFKFLSGLSFSPDGRKIGFVVKKADLEENDYTSQIWIYDLKGRESFRLTAGRSDDNFIWLNNEQIVFTARREESGDDERPSKTSLYRININGGEAEHLVTLPTVVHKYRFRDDRTIIFSGTADLTGLSSKSKEEREREKDYQVVEEIPFWSNGKGFTSGERIHLYLYDLENDSCKDLTEGSYHLKDFALNDDRVCLNMQEINGKAEIESDLYLYNLTEMKLDRLTADRLRISSVHFDGDKRVIFTAAPVDIYGLNTNVEFYEFALGGEKVKKLTAMDKAIGSTVGSDSRLGGGKIIKVEDSLVYFITTEGYNSFINVFDGARISQLVSAKGSVDMFDLSGGLLAYTAFRNSRLQDIYLFREGEEERLTGFNGQILSGKEAALPEYFPVTASDGCKLDTWIIKPANFEEGRKYPAVLEIHGGPKTAYGEVYFHEFQVLAAEGYVVIYSNPRGSDGRGADFADIRGKYGTRDYQDLMEVMDIALERYDFIDPERLGVAGGSYGGYMTNWIIGHTDRFKAAVSQRSIASWISMFGTSDIGYFFTEDQFAGATPWNDHERLWEGSPLKYADRAVTPTLFIHSEEDYRCWLVEGIQMFTALKYHGTESRLVIFKGENHELSRGGKPEHRIRRLEEIISWFDRFL